MGYARFMDDWVILSPSRWKLRRAVAMVNQTLDALRVKQHPDKTFVGKTCRGFDFLGYQFEAGALEESSRLGISDRALDNRDQRIHRLYEQGADSCRIGEYVRRWWSWAKAGLGPSARLMAVPQSVPFTPPDADASTAGPVQAE